MSSEPKYVTELRRHATALRSALALSIASQRQMLLALEALVQSDALCLEANTGDNLFPDAVIE